MCKPSAEGKLVFTMPRRSHQSDKFQFSKIYEYDIERNFLPLNTYIVAMSV